VVPISFFDKNCINNDDDEFRYNIVYVNRRWRVIQPELTSILTETQKTALPMLSNLTSFTLWLLVNGYHFETPYGT
jgi:hypothetical protein